MRRIIQICSNLTCLYALCDDGDIWVMEAGKWIKGIDIPQDKPHENKITFEKVSQERKEK